MNYMVRLILTVLILISIVTSYLAPVSAQMVKIMDVTTTIPPTAAEGSLSLSSSIPATTVLTADDEVEYTIQYRSQSSGSWPFVVTASWTKGLVEGTSSTYVDTLDYKINSATNTDNAVAPQIDLQNRTITWDMSALASSSTYHEVKFTLKVRSDVAQDQRSTATVSVNGSLNSVTLTGHSQDTIVEESSVVPTATPTITPTPTPGSSSESSSSSPTSTPTPTPTTSIAPSFVRIELLKISSHNASVYLITNPETSYSLRYGQSAGSMNTNVSSLDFANARTIQFDDLKPNTHYFFRITIRDKNGKNATSDIFTFKTAKSDSLIDLNQDDVVISSNNILLSSKSPEGVAASISNIILTPHTPLTLSLKVNNPENISSIIAKVQNARVLGIVSYASEPPIQEVKLLELFPGIFSGELRAPSAISEYRLVLEVRDQNGSYSVATLPNQIFISQPLRVVNDTNHEPVEKAYVTFKKKVDRNGIFVPLEGAISYKFTTDADGYLNVVLPTGIYEVSTSAIGYRKSVSTVDLRKLDSYPTLALTPSFSIKEIVVYYYDAVVDSIDFLIRNASIFFISHRSQDASFLLVILAVFFCGMLVLSIRLHTNIIGIPIWTVEHTLDHVKHFFRIGEIKKQIIVYEGNNYHKSLPGVHIVIMDKNNRSVLSKKSDLVGKTTVPEKIFNKLQFPLTVFTYRKGYSSLPTRIEKESAGFEYINLFMTKEAPHIDGFSAFFGWYMDITMIMVSDLLLLGVVGFTICFMIFQGIIASIPYLFMSGLLIIFWFIYLHQIWHFQKQENRYTP